MKGVDKRIIYSLIVLLIAIVIVFVLITNSKSSLDPMPTMTQFYWYCNHWRANNYYEGHGAPLPDGTVINMAGYCSAILGFNVDSVAEEAGWDKCRKRCDFGRE